VTEKGYEISDMVHGDTVTEVLNYVQFNASDLLQTFRRKVSNALELPRQEANAFIADYVAGLEGYTYLEGEVPAEVPVPANGVNGGNGGTKVELPVS
jgi:arginine decarboxylase